MTRKMLGLACSPSPGGSLRGRGRRGGRRGREERSSREAAGEAPLPESQCRDLRRSDLDRRDPPSPTVEEGNGATRSRRSFAAREEPPPEGRVWVGPRQAAKGEERSYEAGEEKPSDTTRYWLPTRTARSSFSRSTSRPAGRGSPASSRGLGADELLAVLMLPSEKGRLRFSTFRHPGSRGRRSRSRTGEARRRGRKGGRAEARRPHEGGHARARGGLLLDEKRGLGRPVATSRLHGLAARASMPRRLGPPMTNADTAGRSSSTAGRGPGPRGELVYGSNTRRAPKATQTSPSA